MIEWRKNLANNCCTINSLHFGESSVEIFWILPQTFFILTYPWRLQRHSSLCLFDSHCGCEFTTTLFMQKLPADYTYHNFNLCFLPPATTFSDVCGSEYFIKLKWKWSVNSNSITRMQPHSLLTLCCLQRF